MALVLALGLALDLAPAPGSAPYWGTRPCSPHNRLLSLSFSNGKEAPPD